MPTIKIFYDNKIKEEGLTAAWGFSALVKYKERNILFDAGGDSKILASNMKKMKSDPKHIEFIVISHAHWDHVGGLSAVLDENKTVYLLKSFPESLKKAIRIAGAKPIEVSEPQQIVEGIHTTGELGHGIKEQALVVDSGKGLIIITGCAHPGIVEIVKKSKELFNKPIYFVLGGFHLLDKSESEIKKIIEEFKKLGVVYVGPCHCTGDRAIALFKDAYRDKFIEIGVGKVLDTKSL